MSSRRTNSDVARFHNFFQNLFLLFAAVCKFYDYLLQICAKSVFKVWNRFLNIVLIFKRVSLSQFIMRCTWLQRLQTYCLISTEDSFGVFGNIKWEWVGNTSSWRKRPRLKVASFSWSPYAVQTYSCNMWRCRKQAKAQANIYRYIAIRRVLY